MVNKRMLEINEEFEKYWKEAGKDIEDQVGIREIVRDAWFACQIKCDEENDYEDNLIRALS
jgi:hypothetical protein